MKVVTLKLVVDGVSYTVRTFENTSLQISKTVSSFEYLSDVGTITEQTFRIPYEAELINAIGDLVDTTTSLNINPNKEIQGSILVDGYPLFNGSFQIIAAYKSVVSGTSELELLFSARESQLKARLSNILLTDLFEGETIPYTFAEIETCYNDVAAYIADKGIFWPLIDYGQHYTTDNTSSGVKDIYNTASPLTVADFKPVIQLKKVLDLLESKEGVTIKLDSEIEWLRDEQFLTLSNGDSSSLVVLDTSTQQSAGYMFRSVNAGAISVTHDTKVILNFNQVVNYNDIVFTALTDAYLSYSAGVHQFSANLKYDIFTVTADSNKVINFDLYNVTTNTFIKRVYSRFEVVRTTVQSRSINISFSHLIPEDEVGDSYALYIETQAPFETEDLRFILKTDSAFRCTASPAISSASNVLIGQSFQEELTVWDCVKSIVLQSNGIILENTPSEGITVEADTTLITADSTLITADNDDYFSSINTYNIIAWKDWIDLGETVNLNDKLQDAKDLKIESFSVEGAKQISFKYSEGSDYWNEKTRDLLRADVAEFKIKDTGTDFTKKKLELELPFAPTPAVPIFGSDASIPKFVDEGYEPIEDQTNLVRINVAGSSTFSDEFYCANAFGAGNFDGAIYLIGHWGALPSSESTSPTTEFKAGLNFYTNYGYPLNDLYSLYWKRYIENTYTQNARKITVSARISSSQLEDLQFNERVLYGGSLWRIIAIKGFDLIKDEPCTIELMKRFELSRLDIAPFYPTTIERGWIQWANSSDNSIPTNPYSPSTAAQLEESALAYGYRYDSRTTLTDPNGNTALNGFAIQVGQILL